MCIAYQMLSSVTFSVRRPHSYAENPRLHCLVSFKAWDISVYILKLKGLEPICDAVHVSLMHINWQFEGPEGSNAVANSVNTCIFVDKSELEVRKQLHLELK